MSYKKQISFLRPTNLNLAVSVYKEAKNQKSDFFSKIDRVQHRVVIWGVCKGKSAKNGPNMRDIQNLPKAPLKKVLT